MRTTLTSTFVLALVIAALLLGPSGISQAAPASPAAASAVTASDSAETGLIATNVYGPYYSYHDARRMAYYLEQRGYYTRIVYRHGYYYVYAS
jgi:hypothetical protein